MFRRLLVPLDGSNFAEHALPRALEVAARFDGTLEIATVAVPYGGFPPPIGLPHEATMDSFRDRMKVYLEGVEKRIRENGFTGSIERTVIPAGNVVRSLVRRVTEGPADLIVMTTHGRGWAGRAWLGSTADGVIRNAACPILLVRPAGDESEGADLRPASAPFSKVLVPLDGSKAAERIVPLADAIADKDARKLFVRVVPPLPSFGYAPYLPDVVIEEHDHDAARKDAREYLETFSKGWSGESGAAEFRVMDALPPSEAILKVAQDEAIELIAMTTAGRGGVARLLIGSVADKVVRRAAVPILLSREADTRQAES